MSKIDYCAQCLRPIKKGEPCPSPACKEKTTTSFPDESTNPKARVPLPPRVVEWAERAAKMSRHYYERDGYTAEDVAGFDALLAFARGGQ